MDAIFHLSHMRITDSLKKPRVFRFPNGGQRIFITSVALATFSKFRQSTHNQVESGGLLFAALRLPDIYIVNATPPNSTDRRHRVSYVADRKPQKQIIHSYFTQGLHLIGEWHTHPEPNPTPSGIDYKSMSEAFRYSRHELDSFIMIIVGNNTHRLNLWVSAHNECSSNKLEEETRFLDRD